MTKNTVELLTIDFNIAWDYLRPSREHHDDAVSLFELNGEAVELAMAPQGRRLDADESLQREVEQLCENKNITELRQLAYLSEATFPSTDLLPGQVVPAFQKDWDAALAAWRTHEGPMPRYPDNLHLETHILEDRDVFITRDRGLLVMSGRLNELFGYSIEAMTCRRLSIAAGGVTELRHN